MINTCAMGVTIPTSLPGINLSVRSDKALALLRALKPYYEQFVVTSDVYFLKKLLEDGRSAGMRWSNWPVQFAMGGEWFPESYRQYLASLVQVDLDRPTSPDTHPEFDGSSRTRVQPVLRDARHRPPAATGGARMNACVRRCSDPSTRSR